MHAKDIMSAPAYTVRADAPVAAAVDLLERQSITAVPVVDEGDVLVGLVTEETCCDGRQAAPRRPTSVRAGSVT